jgi:hypothetical protein
MSSPSPGAPYEPDADDVEWIVAGTTRPPTVTGQRLVLRPSALFEPVTVVPIVPPPPLALYPNAAQTRQEPPHPARVSAVLDLRPALFGLVVFSVARERDWLQATATAARADWIAAHPSDPAPPSVGPFASTAESDAARAAWTTWAAAHPGDALGLLALGAFLPLAEVAPLWGWTRAEPRILPGLPRGRLTCPT